MRWSGVTSQPTIFLNDADTAHCVILSPLADDLASSKRRERSSLMCGIAGFVGRAARGDAVASMLHALRRRGPDSHGMYEWPGAVLGHRRLAIFDRSAAGHQPILSPNGEIGIVFNGAIYNFRPLRLELEQEGFVFLSE